MYFWTVKPSSDQLEKSAFFVSWVVTASKNASSIKIKAYWQRGRPVAMLSTTISIVYSWVIDYHEEEDVHKIALFVTMARGDALGVQNTCIPDEERNNWICIAKIK